MDRCREVLRAALAVINAQQAVLDLVLPTAQDMGKCLMECRQPTPEQVSSWDTVSTEVTAKMFELTARLKAVQIATVPFLSDA